MKEHEFLIILRDSLWQKEGLHQETLLIPEENCYTLSGRYMIRGTYLVNTLIPYFDLLHEYLVLEMVNVKMGGGGYSKIYHKGVGRYANEPRIFN